MFFGWQCVERDDEFCIYQRVYDGELQVIANDPPRWFVADDYNDAVAMSEGTVILGPGQRH